MGVLLGRQAGGLVVAALIVTLSLPGPGLRAGTGQSWDACRDQVIARRQSAGRRDYGDPWAYTGATGAGVLDAVIARCGYRDGASDPAFCEDLYEQVYLVCREAGLTGMPMVARSWVAVLDPAGPVMRRLRRACEDPAPLERAAFGRRVCGE